MGGRMAKFYNGRGFIPYIEDEIEKSPELAHYIYNTPAEAFSVGNLVEVSYFKRLCKIVKLGKKYLTVSPVDEQDKKYRVAPKFTRMYEGNPNTAKVLYGAQQEDLCQKKRNMS